MVDHELRNMVSERMLHSANDPRNKNLTITSQLIGARAHLVRNYVQDDYSKEMLANKIIVVCQRDQWEGHYR